MNTNQLRVFPSRFSSLAAIGKFVAKAAGQAGLDKRAAYAVQLAVDEACSNIIEHAYQGRETGEIECSCQTTPQGLTVVLRDQGKPFDPTQVSKPDTSASLENRTGGGLGVYFIRKLMDRVEYKSHPGPCNVLTLVKHREPAP